MISETFFARSLQIPPFPFKAFKFKLRVQFWWWLSPKNAIFLPGKALANKTSVTKICTNEPVSVQDWRFERSTKEHLDVVYLAVLHTLQSIYSKRTVCVGISYLYRWSACRLAAISTSHLSPLFRSFSLLYSNSSCVSVEYSKFGPWKLITK